MKIGGYDVFALETGRFALDGGAMFGVVPKVIWSKSNPADAQNRIELALRVLLLISADRVILVDTGIGDKFPPKFTEMYDIDHSRFSLVTSLQQHGLTPADVTDVVLTHLHFDHAGGATCREGEQIVPTFPQARYHVQRKNWEWAQNPTEKDRASYLPENFIPLHEHGQLHLVEGEQEILPGIFPWLSEGHTVGQQLIRVTGPEQTLIYCADIIPTATHIPIPFVMGYDLFPVTTMAEKKQILQQAVTDHWLIFFEHDPNMDACYVHMTDKGVRLAEAVLLG